MIKKSGLLSLCLSFLMILSACGGETVGEDGNVSKLKDGDLIVRENVNKINIAAGSFDTFNPIMTKSPSVAEFMKSVCEPLFEYDEAYNPVGVLATNYAVSANGMTVSFDVASVAFHDGTPLTPADVVYTVNMIKENDTLYSDSVKYIKEIYADANGKVYIRLTNPVVNFAGMLNFPVVKRGTPNIVDANYIPVGTGAFKYFGKETSNQVTFTENTEWHGGSTGYKRVIVNILKDSNTVIHAFDAGAVDILPSELFKGDDITPRGEFVQNDYTTNALTFLGINNTSNKLSGKSTRQALEMLVDREKIVSVELYSKGTPAKFPINPSAWFYPQIEEGERDYEAARKLLKTDGWEQRGDGFYKSIDGVEIQLSLRILVNQASDEKVRIAQNIASAFSSFGIPTTLREMDFDGYKVNVSDKSYDLFIGEVITDKSMDPSFLTASGGNYFGYVNAELDEVLKTMACTAEGNQILELSKRYGEIFALDMPFVPLFFRKENVIYSKNISGICMPTCYRVYRDLDKWYASQTK